MMRTSSLDLLPFHLNKNYLLAQTLMILVTLVILTHSFVLSYFNIKHIVIVQQDNALLPIPPGLGPG